ncbi:MAG: acetate--CoA ligase family protein [Smithellaceae bacterium]|nr:acetate--CoA ligase family protein [Smithellaceae bacterium]
MLDNYDSDIRFLFEPRSIAVIGASTDKTKVGSAVLRNILAGGYRGKIYPINPKGGKLKGLDVHEDIRNVPDDVDVACIAVPAPLVYDCVVACADRAVKYAVIISAGFSEIGRFEEEKKIVEYARAKGMRLLGPNVFGLYSSSSFLNATFISGPVVPGRLAIVTQSGALGLTMAGKAAVAKIGISSLISVGNKADIDEADVLQYLMCQEDTAVVLLYIEGIRDGEKFLRILKRAADIKPIVIIKSGRSERGAIAAVSHTGSLAGPDDVFDDLIRQCGGLRSESAREAFNWCKILSELPIPAGENTVIITNGGGAGVLAADAFERYGVPLYDNVSELNAIFSSFTPEFGATGNPIDLTGQASAEQFSRAFDAALAADNIHAAFGVLCESALMGAEGFSRTIDDQYASFRNAGKPVIYTLLGGEKTEDYLREARNLSFPVFDDVLDGASAFGALYSYRRHRLREDHPPEDFAVQVSSIESISLYAKRDLRYFLYSHEAHNIMQITGIPTPKTLIALTLDGAVRSATAIGYPVVMKIVSRDIAHKSDVGAVALDLEHSGEVIDAYGAIIKNCRTRLPHAAVEGIEIAEMASSGLEMIVGARKDPIFGPLIMVGMGGIYVEVFRDVSFRSLPIDRREILAMIKQLKSYPLLLGERGEPMRDMDALVGVIIKLGAILTKCSSISEIEINPLIVYEQGKGVKAVDVRVALTKD